MATVFQGFLSPNFTQVPDELFDELMSSLSGSELKVLPYIIRRTFGFKKTADNISLNQICNGITTRNGEVIDQGTGLSQQSVITALKGLVDKNAIVATRRVSREKGNEPTTYSLNLRPFSNNLTTPSPKIREALPQKVETQETVTQETDVHLRNSKANSLEEKHEVPNVPVADSAASDLSSSHAQPSTRAGESQPSRTGSTRPIGEILAHHQVIPPQPSRQAPAPKIAPTPQIEAAVESISGEFADSAHLRSNLSQAANLWQASGRSEASFVSSLYEARSITKQQRNVRRPMPYFWSTLRDLLHLKTDDRALEQSASG